MYNFGHAPFTGHMSYLGGNFGLLGGLIGLFVWVAVIAVIVAVVVAIVRRGHKAHAPVMPAGYAPTVSTPDEDAALRIARERLARGEIEPEQYRAIVEALSS